MDGVAARGLMSGRGPSLSDGRDVVGTCSDGAKPNLPYCADEHKKGTTIGYPFLLLFSHQLLILETLRLLIAEATLLVLLVLRVSSLEEVNL